MWFKFNHCHNLTIHNIRLYLTLYLPIDDSTIAKGTNSISNASLNYHRKHQKQKKMKMMILKHGRITNDKDTNAIKSFHYFPDKPSVKQGVSIV